jgi:putative flippase GtrA
MTRSWANALRAAKFGTVGASGVLVNMLVLWLLKARAGAPLWLASGAAIELSILNNFIWNYHWTFGDRQGSQPHDWHRALVKYHLAVSAAAVSNFILLWLLHERWGMDYLLANALGIVCGFAINYLFSNQWVFKKRGPQMRANNRE